MKILLDECVDQRLAAEIISHDVKTVPGIAVVVLHAPSNRLADLKTLVPQLLAVLPQAIPGQVTVVGL